MGINLSDIVVLEPRKLEDFSGKILAIDAFNTLYQFLAIIRQPNGTPLMDRQGRVTSHLSGLIYRLSNFVEAGIKPVFVFDGAAAAQGADDPVPRRDQTEGGAGVAGSRRNRRPRDGADEGHADVPTHGRDDRSIETPPGTPRGPRCAGAGGGRGPGERNGPKRDRARGRVAGLRRSPVRFPSTREEPRH